MYWAHSRGKNRCAASNHEGWQPLALHLEAVADLAASLASMARPGDATFSHQAALAGLMHDYGKYSDCFQRMLGTGQGRCQHAIHGAMLTAGEPGRRPVYPHIALAIAGHHAGVPDFQGDGRALAQKLRDANFSLEARNLRVRAAADCPRLHQALQELQQPPTPPTAHPTEQFDLTTRMLFSCLVDADRLNSAGRQPQQASLQALSRLQRLLSAVSSLHDKSADGLVKQMRARVLDDCLFAAEHSGDMFSLSVPTGGGKTLAAMAFALRRAALHPDQFRRIIVVIPYLSIIEQNAEVYANVFGRDAVLEHHSGSAVALNATLSPTDDEGRFVPAADPDDEEDLFQTTGMRPETENWDAPLIVTTSVRFFESLFSNHPRDLRRVHNVARSIVILDEVQTLPRRLLAPLLEMKRELTRHWGVNFVFATATQPAFERSTHGPRLMLPRGTVHEIVRRPAELRQALVRARLLWDIGTPLGWSQVASRVLGNQQCLAIVNVRGHANDLYQEVLRQAGQRGIHGDAVFHLSTRMCAAHRLRVLDRVRKKLEAAEPCYVVSTQLIEAGVDVDFPVVFRALAPLDSIVQAAGRADREGRLTARLGRPGGEVVVFLPADNKMPPNEYKEAAGITESLCRQAIEDGEEVQVDSVAAMKAYFDRYYGQCGEQELGSKLMEMRRQLKFSSLADEFEMISNRSLDVFVPDDDEARDAIASLRAVGRVTSDVGRKLRRHTVGLNPSEFRQANAAGALEEIRPGSDLWAAVEQAYDDKVGLRADVNSASFIC